MAAARTTSIWTVVLNALLRVLAVLGIARRPRSASAVAAAVDPAPAGAVHLPLPVRDDAAPPARFIPAQAKAPSVGPREQSLPPTIKQRIHAEAHGSSPSVRRVAVGLGDGFLLPDADS